MKTENIKPNYSELDRLHECDRRTIKKYNEGYEGRPIKRNKESRLDKYKEEIKTKLELPGSTIKCTYDTTNISRNSQISIDISYNN